ncbi:MAG: hypothetical protein DHS20C18_41530 [Saprospiraceae bacterium]|nr:MAG: hypothetical protein DHS20C18_41530 [Saprospiraceae bacterium]
MKLLIPVFCLLIFCGCAVHPKGAFELSNAPIAPDYSKPASWAALPDREDPADRRPDPELPDNQSTAEIDVFFLHPTTYTGDRGQELWNGPINNDDLNKKTDGSTILYQASIFNGTGRVYAPRYRQAHLEAYFTKNKAAAKKAFDLAYSDVKQAFDYFLNHYNQGRPFIIASHSQGTTHAKRLMREYLDGTPLQEKLVAAYLIGIPVNKEYFSNIEPCESPDQIGCFCAWRSFKKGYFPENKFTVGDSILVTNPLSWTTTDNYVSKSENEGGILRDFETIFPNLADAQVHKGLLWVTKPKFPWSFLLTRRNYHVADLNLYYINVRNNAMLRAANFLKQR